MTPERPAENIIRRKSADIKGNNKRIKQVAEDFPTKPQVQITRKKLLDFFGKKLYNNMYVFFCARKIMFWNNEELSSLKYELTDKNILV